MTFRVIDDKVVIKRLTPEEKTSFGLIIPETAQQKSLEGIVVSVGPGIEKKGKLVPMNVNVGDKVLFTKGAGTEVKMHGETYLVVRESDIYGIVE